MTDFTRYMTPLGCGVAAHYSGLLYKREEVDPEIERLTADCDRYKARAERAEAGLKEIRDRDDGMASDHISCHGCYDNHNTACVTLAQIDAEPAGDVCENCKRQYSVVYRVPNDIWVKIAPDKESLGDNPEHQFGGLLCPDCANDAAAKLGFKLIFCAEVFEPAGWPECIHMTAEMARNCPTCNPEGFATSGAEERWCEDVENACPYCGGSGHKGDVSEPAGVKVKPGKLERIVWSAMVWARENPGPDEVPEYTDSGNSFAETECRATVARILAALEPGQTKREGWEQAKEAAGAKNDEKFVAYDKSGGDRYASGYADACRDFKAAIRAMPYPGDSQ